MPKKQLVAETLVDLHRRLNTLPTRSHERRMIMQETANLYGVSEQTLYRALAQRARPRALRRSDRGTPRVLPQHQDGVLLRTDRRPQDSDIE
jgi:DeoR/GlpR family transcriptional regulator of sugar metabolism